MLRLLWYRALRTVPVAWLIVSALFLLSRSLPQPELDREEVKNTVSLTELGKAESTYRQRLGLQQPLFYFSLAPWQWHGLANQYHTWLTGVVHGDFGNSYRDGRPATARVTEALAVTLPLTTLAFVLTAVSALLLTLLMSRYSLPRVVLLPALYGLDSLPLVLISLLLLLGLANPDTLALFPAYGMDYGGDASELPWWQQLPYLILPAASLMLVSLPLLVIPFEAALRQVQEQPYTVTAKAKGLTQWKVLTRHSLPNAVAPFITRLTDLLPGLVAGAAVVEVMYALPGMGRLLVEASAARDYPVLLAGTCLIAAARLLSWLLADVLTAATDPRIRTT
jgi:peptide/nickel transport system permease protein